MIDYSSLPDELKPYADDLYCANDRRFPIICQSHPSWFYITAVLVSEEERFGPIGIMPTERELDMIGSFHEQYLSYWYGPPGSGWRATHLEMRPFDIDGGANGITFIKWGEGSWGYRRRTWSIGPTFAPGKEDNASLTTVMDRIHTMSSKWTAWKAVYPEVFGASSDHG